MSGSTSNFENIASEHIGHRCVLRDVRTLECVDCSRKLVLPREPKTIGHTGPPRYVHQPPPDLPSTELIALRKREALAAVEHARLKRTTATEEPA